MSALALDCVPHAMQRVSGASQMRDPGCFITATNRGPGSAARHFAALALRAAPGTQIMSFFAVENLGVRFGGVVAVDGVSFEVKQGEVYTIIGPNGAGKTTIFNLIGLIYPPTSGRILFEIARWPARRTTSPSAASRARSRTSSCSSTRPGCEFADRAASIASPHQPGAGAWLFLPSVRRAEIAQREAVERVIDLLDLQHYPRQSRGGPSLRHPQGDRARPRARDRAEAVLLDEPSSGLNPDETDDMAFWIEDNPEGARHYGADGRARHEPGVARPRTRVLALKRGPRDREGNARAGAAASRGDRGLSRGRGVMFLSLHSGALPPPLEGEGWEGGRSVSLHLRPNDGPPP